jgi:uncharacterized protein
MDPLDGKSWLPEGTTKNDLDDGDFAWLSDAYKAGDESKTQGRKLPYKISGTVNDAGWRAAWSRSHQMADGDFDGGPGRDDVYKTLLADKPKDIEVADDGKRNPVPAREYKTLTFKAAAPADGEDALQEGEFEGYGAAFGNVDACGDIIEKGAFARSLAEFLKSGVLCWQHDWSEPIGKPLEAREDDQGLYLKGRVSQTARGKDALTLLRDGVVTKMSIGYEVEAYRVLSDEEGIALLGQEAYDAAMRDLPWWQDGIRVLTQIKLYEISLVSVPANMNAVVTGVKDLGLLTGLTLDDHFKAVLVAEREYITRVKGLAALRIKEGRMLSASNREKLSSMRDSLSTHVAALDDLLATSDPEGSGVEEDGKASPVAPVAPAKAEPDAPEPPTAPETKDPALAASARKELVRLLKTESALIGVR